MELINVDLFGHPVAIPHVSPPSGRIRKVSVEAKRAKLIRHLEESNNLMLFDELLDFLKAPLLKNCRLPTEYESDVGGVAVAEDDDDEITVGQSVQIPYVA